MLGLTVKGIAYHSHRLDPAKGEHKMPQYLALNLRGQVPTLRAGSIMVRESVAILAFLDHHWRGVPLFGRSSREVAEVWQRTMDHENNLQPALATAARILLRGEAEARSIELQQAAGTIRDELGRIEAVLERRAFLAGDGVTAADCVVYPSVAWLRRALSKAGDQEVPLALTEGVPAIDAWSRRVEAIPNFQSTYPPHWRD